MRRRRSGSLAMSAVKASDDSTATKALVVATRRVGDALGPLVVDRDALVAPVGGDRLDDLVGVDMEVFGDLVGGGRSAQSVVEQLVGGADLETQLLQPAGDVHGPCGITEVPAQLTADGDGSERLELHAVVGIEPLRRLEQGDTRNLDEVLERFTARPVLAGEGHGEPAMLLDDRIAQAPIASVPISTQRVLGRRSGGASWRASRAAYPSWPAAIRHVANFP